MSKPVHDGADTPIMDAFTLVRTRESRGMTRAEIARATRLSPRVLDAIEEGRLQDLPAGVYARNFLRAYATAVGADADAVLLHLAPMLPSPAIDLLALADLRKGARRHRASRYLLAGAIDAGVLSALCGAIVVVCGVVCGLSPSELLRVAPGAMVILWLTTAVLYFWLLGATDVKTAGPFVLGLDILPRVNGPIRLNVLLRRGAAYVEQEIALMFTSSSRESEAGVGP
jgi:transcriptional regulator with XRE-family HTH domain